MHTCTKHLTGFLNKIAIRRKSTDVNEKEEVRKKETLNATVYPPADYILWLWRVNHLSKSFVYIREKLQENAKDRTERIQPFLYCVCVCVPDHLFPLYCEDLNVK